VGLTPVPDSEEKRPLPKSPPQVRARWPTLPWHAWVGTAWMGPVGGVMTVVVVRAFNGNAVKLTIEGVDLGFASIATIAAVVVWVVLWFVSGLFYLPFTSPAKANTRNYGELRNRLATLDARRRALCEPSPSGAPPSATSESACKEAQGYLDWVRGQIHGTGDLRWVNGAGYIDLWQRLHRAEEALLMATPKEQLLDQELYDELRLKDSAIPNRDDLMGILRAVKRYLCGAQPDPTADLCIDSVEKAASALTNVRFSINDFRDSSWNGLLQLRNQTMTTLLLTNITLFAFADGAVIGGASGAAMLSATVFLLVGSAVGFFNRLNSQFQAQAAVEDYGLTSARILAIPAYSGMAAVAGVVITSVAGVATGATPPSLSPLFVLPPSTGLLLVAAAFGAAPDLVLSRLGDASEKLKNGIASTDPGARQPSK
jgi:hypothetical protein